MSRLVLYTVAKDRGGEPVRVYREIGRPYLNLYERTYHYYYAPKGRKPSWLCTKNEAMSKAEIHRHVAETIS